MHALRRRFGVVASISFAVAGLVPASSPGPAWSEPAPVAPTWASPADTAEVGTAAADVAAAGVVPSFSDVPTSSPFYGAITWLAWSGVTTGWPDRTFRPSAPITREAMAAFLYRYAGSPAFTLPAVSPFSDVPRSHPFFAAICWLAEQGISTGWADRTFRPSESITREAMSAFLYRFATSPAVEAPTTSPFEDVASDHPFYAAITWLADEGISTGWPDHTFRPSEPITREAMAAFLFRFERTFELGGRWALLVSAGMGGTQSNGGSASSSVSADGRWIAFDSSASNLVAGDTNGHTDVFVLDRTTGSTTRVSTASDGTEGNGTSNSPTISPDGRWVVYGSWASNLVAGDTNNRGDVFVTDRTTGETTRVSTATDGTQANGESFPGSISADGRWVTYTSFATNLVAGDTNARSDVFVTDLATDATFLVSAASDGTQGDGSSQAVTASEDGRWVAYTSSATNLVADDTNGVADVFVTDVSTGTTTRVSTATDGGEGNGQSRDSFISADGRWVTYVSDATNLVPGDTNAKADLFATDRTTGVTMRVATVTDFLDPENFTWGGASSADGRWVAYPSEASDLVPGDTNGETDVFVTDLTTGETARVSPTHGGALATSQLHAAMSADGRWIVFDSYAEDLVAGDTNGVPDVFAVRNPLTLTP